jgi:D-tagatose-1,6-bisphosphate aldolase subunit GatZ/KbaZ
LKNFASTDFLQKIVSDQKMGFPIGAFSVCSSNLYVLQASMQFAKEDNSYLLIESTCNQVNQFGGYTGMTTNDFSKFIRKIASKEKFPVERILLGGDHLGPNPWKHQNAETAMLNAKILIRDYIDTGFRKIHLDTSMNCADDDLSQPLNLNVIAERTADLCHIAEATFKNNPLGCKPVYIIGTEVPTPGGGENNDGRLLVTSQESVKESLDRFKLFFSKYGLEDAWNRVIAIVVQPGVEFTNSMIFEYDHNQVHQLSKAIETFPGIVYEAHSTDYQRPELLKQMVADHFAILKVGPGLTFAFREAIFALASIEEELFLGRLRGSLSNLLETIDEIMINERGFWEKYYTGDEFDQKIARKYSLSDRIRYYWTNPKINNALNIMLTNLKEKPIPLSLVSQYLPNQYKHIRDGKLINEPISMISDHIGEILAGYRFACNID